MGLDFKEMHIPLAEGVGQKEDPRALPAPKLAVCENAVFDEVGGIQKRTGFDLIEPGASIPLGGDSDAGIGGSGAGGSFLTIAGGTIDTDRIRGLSARDNELLLFAQGRLYALSAKEGAWMDRGRHEGVLIDEEPTLFQQTSQLRGDRAETGNVIVHAWFDVKASLVRWEATDKATGSVFNRAGQPTAGTAPGNPKVRAVNGKILVFYWEATTTLKCVVIDPDDVYTSIDSTALDITTTAHTDAIYDVCDFGNFCMVAVKNSGTSTYDLYKVSSAGAVAASSTAIRSCELGIAVAYDSNTNVFSVARIALGVQAGLDYAVKHDWITASTLADKQVDDLVEAFAAVVAREQLNNITTVVVPVGAAEQAYVLYDVRDDYPDGANNSLGQTNDTVRRAIIDDGGNETLDNFTGGGTYVGSRLGRFTDDTTVRAMVYILYSPLASIEPSYFLCDVEFEAGDTSDTAFETEGMGLMARVLFRSATDNDNLAGGALPDIQDIGSNVFKCILGNRRRLPQAKGTVIFAGEGMVEVTAELFNVRAYKGVEQGKTLYLPGGYMAQYDGEKIVESEFMLAPNVQVDDSGAGSNKNLFETAAGALPAGDYSYRFYWERINAKGERQRSTYLGAKTATVGASKQVDISVPHCPFSLDENMSLAIYRSEVGPGSDAPHYRVTSTDPASTGDNSYVGNRVNPGNGAQTRLTVTDDMLDAVLITQEKDYQNAGALGTVMDYVAPPATKIVAGAQHRMFTGDPADKHSVHHSVVRLTSEGVQFQDQLTIAIPHEGGDFVGLAAIDNGMLIFKKRAIYIIPGSGPDAYGNQPYQVPHPHDLTIGCIDSASIAVTNPGVFFMSHKGPYLQPLNGGDPIYIGADIEDEDLSTIVGVIDQPEERRVFFAKNESTNDDLLVYDYHVKQWSIWTGDTEATKQIIAITRLGSRVVYVNATGVYQSSTTTWRDGANGYSLDVETAWIKPADLQGFVKLRRFSVLGELRAPHNLRIRVAYNYDDSTWTDDITFDDTAVTAGNPLRRRHAFSKRRVQSVKIRITETASTTGGDSSWVESIKLTGLGVEVGRKKGIFKLPATDSQ